jgi:hypothetical protein
VRWRLPCTSVFDAIDDVDRSTPDLRDIAALKHGAEIRLDRFTGEWVGIATERHSRIFLPAAEHCPHEHGGEDECGGRAMANSVHPCRDVRVVFLDTQAVSRL